MINGFDLLEGLVNVLDDVNVIAGNKKQPKIFIVDELPFGLPLRAMTVPPTGIFVKKGFENNIRLMKHEQCHWEQYLRMGLRQFYKQYIAELKKYGYKNMPMEREARIAELK